MIDRNLGNAERVIRLLLGIALALWTLNQDKMNGVEWFVAVCSLFLILNGIFSRCYLWYILDLNSHRADEDPECILEANRDI
ncbi:DUF2892 domain-containing protein [Pseudohalioglobus sediminis]|uniref:DUF2892 domain-containing protein n=1 Tax=Pseudohalioglobus sediminis TaxID=2606449 RepID=A0A5B0X4Z7_9GAMM|nr:DUF2892 domain-containing protein [Pseudohalioglobus sediminis]KAA1194312.1 DUF2892 domain-containing protein [Pseudohalioglobus sediminis]